MAVDSVPPDLEGRLDRIVERLRHLARLDERRAAFGANRHDWATERPLRAEEISAVEQLHDVVLPPDLRGFLERVTASGAGPHYGLASLPATLIEETYRGALPWKMSDRFVGDTTDEQTAHDVARDPSLRGGYLVLADQGCGYSSILVLTGPRRGQVLADMREAHEGFLPEAPAFLDWYERWLDRALIEWAIAALPDILRRGDAKRDDVVRAGLELAKPLLERLANGQIEDEHVLTPKAERWRAIVFLRAVEGRHDEALALVDRVRDLDQRDPEPLRTLTLARLSAGRGDHANQLALAEAGLADERAWYGTKTDLLHEKQYALLALGRREEAIETAHLRAKRTKDVFDYLDVAYLRIEDGEIDGAAKVVLEATEADRGGDDEGPLADRALATAEDLLAVLADEGRVAAAGELRERLRTLAER